MNTNDSERLRRENEELRSQLRAKTRENLELSARVGHLTEVVEDLKQDKQVLRENAKYGKESLARLKEEIAQENSLKNTRIRELEIMLEAAKQSTLHTTARRIKVEPPAIQHVARSNISRTTITVQKADEKQRSPSVEIIEPTIKPSPKYTLRGQLSHADTLATEMVRLSPAESASDISSRRHSNLSPNPPSQKSLPKHTPSSQQGTALGKRKADAPSSSARARKVDRISPEFSPAVDTCSGPSRSTSTKHAAAHSITKREDCDAKPDISRPVIKYKEEEAFVLPPDLMAKYLRDAPALDIKPSPSSLHVRRDYLRLLLGGSDMQFFQKVEAHRNPAGDKSRTLTFPTFDMNPAMPLIPGESGLILSKRPEILEYSPLSLFRRDISGKEAVWQYLGEYETKVVGMMTGELFRQQDSKVQRAWARTILTRKAQLAYRTMKTRISLRKRGLSIPNEAEKKRLTSDAASIQVKEEGEKKGKQEDEDQTWGDLDEEDIIGALLRGEEGVEIVRMQCVSYDRTFAKHIEDNVRRYPEMLEAERARKEKEKKQCNKRKATKRMPSIASSSRRSPIPKRRRTKTSRKQDQDDSESDFEPPVPDRHALLASSPSNLVATSSPGRPRRTARSTWDSQTGRRVRAQQNLSPSPSEAVVADLNSGNSDSDSELSDV